VSVRAGAPLAVLLSLAAAAAVAAAGKPTAPSRLSLVQAQCAGPPPGPCSPAFAFSRGTATLRSARQPAPTRDAAKQRGGDVKLEGVTKNGARFSGTLAAEVVFKTTFPPDANANCELANVQIELVSLMAAVTCRRGRCKGTLRPIGPLPKGCADTAVTSEIVSVLVRDDTGEPLAKPGVGIPAGKRDAP